MTKWTGDVAAQNRGLAESLASQERRRNFQSSRGLGSFDAGNEPIAVWPLSSRVR